ncbi:hypothetical protein KFK09_020458 [Dendrobium nobile]|uniref:Uncharacterized protein n=1 Tax=Dendrobium nobile TaxID=94219 RepID=A0A8T3AT16_DENNO|nr:hypothetical protein KFK09_020458 [Dendrobium nobile]
MCNNRALQVFMVCEGEESSGDELEDVLEETEQLNLEVAEVSLHSMVEFTANHIMKVREQIEEQFVVVLVDNGVIPRSFL